MSEEVRVVGRTDLCTNQLRFVPRDGSMVLQQCWQLKVHYSNGVVEDGREWRDVPVAYKS